MLRPVLKIGLEVAGVAVAAVLILCALLLWRLATGPLSLSILNPTVSNALARALPESRIRFEDTVLEWTDEGPRLRLIGAEAIDAEGRAIASVPKADIALSISGLLAGEVAPRRIALIGSSAIVTRRADGGFVVGLLTGGQPAAAASGDMLAGFLQDEAKAGGALARLQEVAVQTADVVFLDEASGTEWRAPEARVTVRRSAEGIDLDLVADVQSGDMRWTVAVEGRHRRGASNLILEVQVDDLRLAGLAQNAPWLADVAGIDVPLRGNATIDLGLDGAVRGIGLALASGRGRIAIPQIRPEPFAIDGGEIVARYDSESGRAEIETLTFSAEGNSATMSGFAGFELDAAGALAALDFDLAVEPLVLDLPEIFAQAMTFDRIAVRGWAGMAARSLRIAQATLRRTGFEARLHGEIADAPVSPRIALSGDLGALSVEELLEIWPVTLAPGARLWIAHNVAGASRIARGDFRADLQPGDLALHALPEDSLRLDFWYDAAEVIYVQGLTPLTGGKGSATLRGDAFDVVLTDGNVGPLHVSGGSVSIGQLHVSGTPAEVSAKMRGRMQDIAALLDLPPLGYPSKMGISPGEVDGRAEVTVKVVVPTARDVTLDQVAFDIAGKTQDLSLTMARGVVLSEGALDVRVSEDKLVAEGPAMVNGAPVRLSWTELFDAAGPAPSSTVRVAAAVDGAARAALGIPDTRYLNGTVDLTATLRGRRGDLADAELSADLTRAELAVPQTAWSKVAGLAMTARADIRFAEGGAITVDNLRAEGADALVEGTLAFGPRGLERADFERVMLGLLTDARATLRRAPDGAYLVDVAARTIDVEGLAAEVLRDEDGGRQRGPGWRVRGTAERLILKEDARFSGVVAEVTHNGWGLADLQLRASTQGGKPLAASLQTRSDGRAIAVSSADAGAVVRGVFGFGSVAGGDLAAEIVLPPFTQAGPAAEAPVAGTVRMRNFRVNNQPFLARLFAAGSLTGLVELMSGQGIGFTALVASFTIADGILTLPETRASGPSIGVTSQGRVDLKADTVALNGSLVPLFGLNSILGEVPVLGGLLVSRQGEGILGLTYSLTGALEEPDIAVNPLAALTPGILRRIMELGPDVPAQNEAAAPAPTQRR